MYILYLYLILNGKVVDIDSQPYANFASCVHAMQQLAPANGDVAGQCVAYNEKFER